MELTKLEFTNIIREKFSDIAVHMFCELLDSVDSEYATRCAKQLATEGLIGLTSVEFIPSAYDTPKAIAHDYVLYSYLRKYSGVSDKERLTDEAILNLRKVELGNFETNRKFQYGSREIDDEPAFRRARRIISRILGPFSYDKVLPGCDWGKGATSSLKRKDAYLSEKICERQLTVSRKALRYLQAFMSVDRSWMQARLGATLDGPCCPIAPEFEIHDHAVFDTVEKDFRKRRVIDKQPTGNLFLQKGAGWFFRCQLKRFGIDLDNQSRNQNGAKHAQEKLLSTIDLSNASDTICTQLVRNLLDPEWFSYLNDIRTKWTLMPDGTRVRNERFSAMGNGFTFELESIIFYALSRAVVESICPDRCGEICVYGDDIIVPQNSAETLITLLNKCGFSVNDEKSFVEGRFYESCGKHYFDGVEVTPIYQKESICSLISSIRAANRLVRWAARIGVTSLDSVAYKPWSFLTEALVSRTLPYRYTPPSLPTQPLCIEDDGAFIDPWYEPRFDINGLCVLRTLRVRSKRVRVDNPDALCSQWMRSIGLKLDNNRHGLQELLSEVAYDIDTPKIRGSGVSLNRYKAVNGFVVAVPSLGQEVFRGTTGERYDLKPYKLWLQDYTASVVWE